MVVIYSLVLHLGHWRRRGQNLVCLERVLLLDKTLGVDLFLLEDTKPGLFNFLVA